MKNKFDIIGLTEDELHTLADIYWCRLHVIWTHRRFSKDKKERKKYDKMYKELNALRRKIFGKTSHGYYTIIGDSLVCERKDTLLLLQK